LTRGGSGPNLGACTREFGVNRTDEMVLKFREVLKQTERFSSSEMEANQLKLVSRLVIASMNDKYCAIGGSRYRCRLITKQPFDLTG
jgi:hypothetical protein